MKHKALCSILLAVVTISAFGFSTVYEESQYQEGSIIGLVVGALVGIVVAVALIPTIANQTADLEENANLSTAEQSLVGLWPLLIIVGVMMAIIGIAL